MLRRRLSLTSRTHATLTQADIRPGQLTVDTGALLEFNVTLLQPPSAAVYVNVSVPSAWDGSPIADVFPSRLVFAPGSPLTQTLALYPRLVCEGDYHIVLSFRCRCAGACRMLALPNALC